MDEPCKTYGATSNPMFCGGVPIERAVARTVTFWIVTLRIGITIGCGSVVRSQVDWEIEKGRSARKVAKPHRMDILPGDTDLAVHILPAIGNI